MNSERESMPFDVLIVGGGPAGLAASIRLKQLCIEKDVDLSVCVVEKGRYVDGNFFNCVINKILCKLVLKMMLFNLL